MGCSNCGTTHNGLPAGCKNNGVCGAYGCNKLDVFDWLAGMELPAGQKPFDVVEVRFKSSRKGFFRMPSDITLHVGDVVAVEASPGHDVGVVSLTGELVRMQMKHKDVKDNYEIRKVYRKARQEDISRWQEARTQEQATMIRARELTNELRLNMKVSDVEFQGDHTKATFYYTADDRVDFRELIRRFAEEFKVRVEMRQIGLRVEAGRIGGIGSCGRELCCSSWLTDFRSVSTSAARYQQLSLNPTKLAGQCGKLKCCLNYELDQYLEALRDIPSSNTRLQLAKGTAHHFKTDIFKRMMYFTIEGGAEGSDAHIALSVDSVKQIMELNRTGQKPEDVSTFFEEDENKDEISFSNAEGEASLTRFDHKKKGNRGGGRDDRRGGRGRERQRPPQGEGQANQPGSANDPSGKPNPQQRQQRGQQPRRNDGPRPARPQGGQQGGRPPQQNKPRPQGGNPNQGNRPPRGNRPPGGNRPPRDNRDKPQGDKPKE